MSPNKYKISQQRNKPMVWFILAMSLRTGNCSSYSNEIKIVTI